MRRYLFLALALLPCGAGAQINPNPADAITQKTFANLGTPPNGIINFCTDCSQVDPCAGGGTGAFAYRVDGAWSCGAAASGGLTDPGADGFVTRTALSTVTARTLTSPLGTLAIGNSDGVAGNPTLDVDTSIIGQFSSGAGTAPATCVQGDFYYETDTFFVTACPATDSPNTLIGKAETSTAGFGFVIDEDSFATDSATKVPTQQSTKAFIAAQIAGAGSAFNPSTSMMVYSDLCGAFTGGSAWAEVEGFGFGVSGGTTALGTPTPGHPCIQAVGTSTSASAVATFRTSVQAFIATGGVMVFKSAFLIPTLSDGTEGFRVISGFAESTNAPTKGCWIEYEDSLNGGDFQCSCGKGDGTTTADSNVAVANNTWYEVGITINSDSTSAVFTVNGSSVCTITESNPDNADQFAAQTGIVKTSGTTSRTISLDYVYAQKTLAGRY